MNLQLTTLLALWGAVIATVSLGLHVWQWLRSNPRITVVAVMKEGFSSHADDLVTFELRNRGRSPTTVEEVMFVTYANLGWRLLRLPCRTEFLSSYHPDTIKLPVVLQPGAVWKGNCPLEPQLPHSMGPSRRERFEAGKLHWRVKCAHTDRVVAGVVRRESFFERL